ncbi:YncE family protein [Acidisoma sp. C75]
MITRRSALALPLGLALVPKAQAAPMQPLAFVMNSAEGSVSIIDMTTRRVLRTEPTFREPSHWALTADRRTLLICDASGNGLFRFDPVTGAPLGHQRLADPYQIGFTPDNKYFVVNALRLDFVDVYDAASMALVKRFKVGLWPSHLGFSPDSRWSFNSMQNSNSLVSLDLVSMTERWSSKVGETPAGVLWHRGKVLCCIMGGRGFVEVDPENGRVLREVVTGDGAHNIFLDSQRKVLYVSNRGPGRTGLTALDPVSFEIRRTYPIPGGPDDIAIDPQGNIWIAVRFAEKVAVLDPRSGDYTTIPVGRSPHGIFLNTMLANPGRVTAERV